MAWFERGFARSVVILIVACTPAWADPVFPGLTWEQRSPESLGLDGRRLNDLALLLGGRGCVVKDGFVVKTWGDQAEKSDWYSSAKPVLSTLLMFARKEGLIRDFDQPIAEFGWELSKKDAGITFRQLANMTSGYARPEGPGNAFAYNDYAIELYERTLFDKVFKQDPAEAAHAPQRLGALGLEDGLEFTTKNRRIHASVRDWSRIAWLWLNKGRWGDNQLLPLEWFDAEMRPQVPVELPWTGDAPEDDYLKIGSYGGSSNQGWDGIGVYGFNWWFNAPGAKHKNAIAWPDAPEETVMSLGFGGNCSAMIPSMGLMLASAQGDWGKNIGGNPATRMNQALRLLAASAGHVKRPYVISGELRQWHPLTISFDGPESSETAELNPFTDFRLEVIFTHGDKSVRVPGYFAADGRAGESGAESGNIWRVHFTPDTSGEWKFMTSFRMGKNVATSDDPDAGKAAALDGVEGVIDAKGVKNGDTSPYSRGRLVYTGEPFLRYAETKQPHLKAGVDSPENVLAFEDFDATPPTHKFAPHLNDWKDGDPAWRGGKGKALIGALNYLASKKVNSMYFVTMNVRGDGKDVWPWTSEDERFRFDCSKLDQWERVFVHMDNLGIMLHVLTQEQENDQLLDEGELGEQRRLYYRELIARFAHHLAITWNLGEENTNTAAQAKAFATYFQQHDPYKSLVVIHTFPSKYEEIYAPLLGFRDLTGASLQVGKMDRVHKVSLDWIKRSRATGHNWVVALDEIGPADTGTPTDADSPEHDDVRRHVLWGNLMAGGAGVEWFFGYDKDVDRADVRLENWRSWDKVWDQTRIATEFFHAHVPFTEMENRDKLVKSDNAWCLEKEGGLYLVYMWEPQVTIELPDGQYTVAWFNPKTGGELVALPDALAGGPGTILTAPEIEGRVDWVALLARQ
jgi:CubicO group peptidase (beta-lactamase class C family)